jgi:glycosyltransferase involved in cell wall biosynthesis
VRENPLFRPIRVLSIIPTFWPRQGGGQMVLAAIAQGLSPGISNTVLTRGFEGAAAHEAYEYLSVYRYRNPAPEAWKDSNAGVQHVTFLEKLVVAGLDIVWSLPSLHRLAAACDVVHVHFPVPLGLSALMVRAFNHRPLVVTVHGNADVYELPSALAPITRAVLKRADAVVSVSRDLGRYLQSEMGIEQVTVIPNGIDVEAFHPGSAPGSALTLLSICRLVPRKNVHVLVEAVQQLVNEGASLSLVIAGTGPERERIERLASRSPASVRFVGFIDEAQKRELLSAADVFVQLSMREGLSIAALEALASGVPCLVSNIPGVREPVDAGQTGWYVDDPENVQSAVAALRCVLADRSKLPEMKRACRAVAVARYSLRTMCEGYWNVYTDLVKARPESSRGGRA